MTREWNPIRWFKRKAAEKLAAAADAEVRRQVERSKPPAPAELPPPVIHTVEAVVPNGGSVRAAWEAFEPVRWRGFSTESASPFVKLERLTLNGFDRLHGERPDMPRVIAAGDVVEVWLSLNVAADGLYEVPAKVHFMWSPI